MAQFTLLDTQLSIHTSRTACGQLGYLRAMVSTSISLSSIRSQSTTTSLCGKFLFLSQWDHHATHSFIIHRLMAHINHTLFMQRREFKGKIQLMLYWTAQSMFVNIALPYQLSRETSSLMWSHSTFQYHCINNEQEAFCLSFTAHWGWLYGGTVMNHKMYLYPWKISPDAVKVSERFVSNTVYC